MCEHSKIKFVRKCSANGSKIWHGDVTLMRTHMHHHSHRQSAFQCRNAFSDAHDTPDDGSLSMRTRASFHHSFISFCMLHANKLHSLPFSRVVSLFCSGSGNGIVPRRLFHAKNKRYLHWEWRSGANFFMRSFSNLISLVRRGNVRCESEKR